MRQQVSKHNILRLFGRRLAVTLCLAAMICRAVPMPSSAQEDAQEEQPAAHVHTESCYSTGRHLICGLEESEGHWHDESCRGLVRGELWCTDNTWEHIHTDECYVWTTELICGMEEGEGAHTHGEDCYEEERVLICELAETAEAEEPEAGQTEAGQTEAEPIENGEAEEEAAEEPTEEPAEEQPEDDESVIGPGDGIISLLQMQRELSFADESDPMADLEDEVDWWRMFAGMELSGNWAEDLIRVAESQLGYTESELNFDAEDPWHPKGYTRYGEWFGIPYGDWCAMFISFCLYYAEIPSDVIPYNCHCGEWVRELSQLGLYRHWDTGYMPKPGDLVFFDFDEDEKAEHVGIITAVDENRGWLYTIEGNRYDYVESFVLTMDDYSIIGYCALPENPCFNPGSPGVERMNGKVEIPPDPVEPTPPSWDSLADAAAGIRSVSIIPTIEASRVTY